MSAIIAQSVTKSFGHVVALKDVSFEIKKGDFVALIGPNGSGKSTLSRLLIGLEEPSSGSIFIDGKPAAQKKTAIGYVPQRFSFDRTLPITVEEFLRLVLCDDRGHLHHDRIAETLALVGLSQVEKKQLGTLSGGQLQRVLIARALMHEREILLLDEPTSSVDTQSEAALHDLLQELHKKGKTIIVVSHELDFVSAYATNVICLNQTVLCSGKPEDVMTSESVKQLFGRHYHPYHHHCE